MILNEDYFLTTMQQFGKFDLYLHEGDDLLPIIKYVETLADQLGLFVSVTYRRTPTPHLVVKERAEAPSFADLKILAST